MGRCSHYRLLGETRSQTSTGEVWDFHPFPGRDPRAVENVVSERSYIHNIHGRGGRELLRLFAAYLEAVNDLRVVAFGVATGQSGSPYLEGPAATVGMEGCNMP